MDPKQTPLIEQHRSLQAKLAPFGGWLMPIQYADGIIAEHNWTRTKASLFDICHMGEFIVHGDPLHTTLNNILTINLAGMNVGQCRYGFMLNSSGGIIDDLVVYRLQQDKWMIVVNAATAENDAMVLVRHLARHTKFEDISAKTAKLDLQGPLSGDVLQKLVRGVEKLEYYTFAEFDLLGEKVIISRTGYTGELGYELYLPAALAAEAWNLLLKDHRVKPAGLGCRDTLRLEMAYPLYGHELDETTTPVEAGLMLFVDMTKDFIGKHALADQKRNGARHRLRCFVCDSRRSPRNGYKIFSGDKEVGVVTSGSFSPSLNVAIGMGYVTPDLKVGDRIIIRDNQTEINAALCDKPFYKNGTAKREMKKWSFLRSFFTPKNTNGQK